MNAKAGRGPLAMYVLLKLLQREAKMVNLQLQLVAEAAVGRFRRAIYRDMDAKITELWDLYDQHEIVCEDFLKKIGAIYG